MNDLNNTHNNQQYVPSTLLQREVNNAKYIMRNSNIIFYPTIFYSCYNPKHGQHLHMTDSSDASSEKTEVWLGIDNVISRSLEVMSSMRATYDLCLDTSGPSLILGTEPIKKAYFELKNRGVKIRFITEITTNNISYCKEMMRIADVRHLDGIKGNFVIADGANYAGIANTQGGKQLPQLIHSNVKLFVEQQQYFFEMLWEKAVPAEQRIKEIEEGRIPEKLEIMQDTQKSIARAFDIMSKTKMELLVLFATEHTFSFALQGEAANIYRKLSENGVEIKLLVPRGGPEIENEQIAKARDISPSINLRFSDVDLNTRITIMISDRNELMSWELKDDTLNDPYLAGGIATYSNIKALASSYAIIFDNLWKTTELAENLRIANIKLEKNDKAMKDFINIAAHELRTPLQPILGLSEMLCAADISNDPKQQRKLVEVINRNAHKLENLAEDILDVTRIESGRLQLSMQKIDLYELAERVVSDFQRSLPADGKITINYQKLSDDHDDDDDDYETSPLAITGDPERIAQVISNLLGNALKFTKEGTINVRVGRRNNCPNSSEAVVYVSDSGQGIDPEVIHKLFERFVSKSEKGTGLGLFISKSIVEAHGGKIWGENNKDRKGARFTFTLPLTT